MEDTTIMLLLGFLASMIAIVTPIIRLNTNISTLNTTLKLFQKNYEENHAKLEKRVDIHGDRIDNLDRVTDRHDLEIENIKKEVINK